MKNLSSALIGLICVGTLGLSTTAVLAAKICPGYPDNKCPPAHHKKPKPPTAKAQISPPKEPLYHPSIDTDSSVRGQNVGRIRADNSLGMPD